MPLPALAPARRTVWHVFSSAGMCQDQSLEGQRSARGRLWPLHFPEHFQVRHILRSACGTFVGNALLTANVGHRHIPIAPTDPACPRLVP